MASICNDERVRFGVVSGHDRKTLRLSDQAVSAGGSNVRVEPALRAELEAGLQQGETLSGFVEASVRKAVEFRRVPTRFHERGHAAWEH